ncbi:MAG TPA: hypothetical protein DCQ36_08430 [Actinobacteria bacterium]|jgi:hypothetical protein|nr:hypothetical protein [Actinomycetota bacterium]
MRRRLAMSRQEAATLLGVPADGDPATVRHAWRLWARIAHPDTGGDPRHFARLEEARRVMLVPVPTVVEVVPRAPLAAVIRRPARPLGLAFAVVVAVALVLLPAALPDPQEMLRLAVAALPGSIAAAGAALWVSRQLLHPTADRGHRILTLLACWLPIVVAQLVVAAVLSVGLITVLPILALPLVAVVAAMDPGSGLWQPSARSRR